MAIPFVVVALFMSMPSSCARKLQEQPPALEFPPPLPEDLLCPPPPPSPMAAFLPPKFQGPLQPPPGPKFPAPLPDDLACSPPPPETTSPPPPIIFLTPEFSFPLQPPPAQEFSSPAPSSSILRWLSGLGSAAVVTLLLLGCKMILTRRAASTQPVQFEMQGAGVIIEMQAP